MDFSSDSILRRSAKLSCADPVDASANIDSAILSGPYLVLGMLQLEDVKSKLRDQPIVNPVGNSGGAE